MRYLFLLPVSYIFAGIFHLFAVHNFVTSGFLFCIILKNKPVCIFSLDSVEDGRTPSQSTKMKTLIAVFSVIIALTLAAIIIYVVLYVVAKDVDNVVSEYILNKFHIQE